MRMRTATGYSTGGEIEACVVYVYLGIMMVCSGRTEREVKKIIVKAKKVLGALNSILKNCKYATLWL